MLFLLRRRGGKASKKCAQGASECVVLYSILWLSYAIIIRDVFFSQWVSLEVLPTLHGHSPCNTTTL
jgi:hypothetical protein